MRRDIVVVLKTRERKRGRRDQRSICNRLIEPAKRDDLLWKGAQDHIGLIRCPLWLCARDAAYLQQKLFNLISLNAQR